MFHQTRVLPFLCCIALSGKTLKNSVNWKNSHLHWVCFLCPILILILHHHLLMHFKVIPHICIARPFCAQFKASFSAPLCTRRLKTWRICLQLILSSVSWKMAIAHQGAWAPHLFSGHCTELIVSFESEKTYLISIAENWINKENGRYALVFSSLPFGNHV